MKKTLKIQLLESIGRIYDESADCKLSDEFFVNHDQDLRVVSDYFNTTVRQSLFVATVFAMNYKGSTVNIKDMVEHFNCNPMKILEFSDDFVHLYEKEIFDKDTSRNRVKLAAANDEFTINEKITEAILQNIPMPDLNQDDINDIIDFLEKFSNLYEMKSDEKIGSKMMLHKAKILINSYLHFPLVKKVESFNFDTINNFIYFYMISRTVSGLRSIDLSRITDDLFESPSVRIHWQQDFVSGENTLLQNDLLELVEARFFNDMEIKLTDVSTNMLSEYGITLFMKGKKKENVIFPSEIIPKKLVFNDDDMKQLMLLKNLFQDDILNKTQDRLIEKGLPKGITVLFYGSPGTGKTESVKQLAKDTDRKIIKVEMSQAKSMWFGESEKVVKRIFTDYKEFAKSCERTPILLFNEADAIISKRRDINSSNVGQTENAIQNIILEELENFEGILIATTNLTKNIDSAFERRFLFKIEFHQPDVQAKAEIWKIKFPVLRESECNHLAAKYDLSGAQIDNIARKAQMFEIVQLRDAVFEDIIEFCDTEKWENNGRVRVGFNKN